jgi:hypothetical protein
MHPTDSSAPQVSVPKPPFRYLGGNLGLGSSPHVTVHIIDANDDRWDVQNNVEWLLRNIDHFHGRCRWSLLAGAGFVYGHSAYHLWGADLEPMFDIYDLIDGGGKVWRKRIPYYQAWEAGERLSKTPHWVGEVRIERSKIDYRKNPTHAGPLKLLSHCFGECSVTCLAVRSPAGRCGMFLEEVLWRIDQFDERDQAELMASLASHFELPSGQESLAA